MGKQRNNRGTCARCSREDLYLARVMPDGRICAACWSKATRTTGNCAGCGQHRLLPARSDAGGGLCVNCGLVPIDFHCTRCSREWHQRHGLCEWCYLDDLLGDLLAAGNVDLTPLRRHLVNVDRPDSIIIWLYNDDVQHVLKGLAAGTIALSYDALDRQSLRRVTDHLVGLLAQAGLLPHRDPYLTRFDRWVQERLPTTADPAGQLLLRQFARWELRPGLAAAARANKSRSSLVVSRTQQLTVAAEFLNELTATDNTPATATQHHLDSWLANPPTTRRKIHGFINFLAKRGITTNVTMPPTPKARGQRLDQSQRFAHLRATLDATTGPIDSRTAAMLLLLYAQPFPILTHLTLQDIRTATTTAIRFADDYIDVPPPFDQLLAEQVANRAGTNTATNGDTAWLFPGQRPGLPLAEASLQNKVRALGISLRHAKAAALADLVTACPPPIVARTLGYTNTTTNRHAAAAGTTWQRYAALGASAAERAE